MRCRVRPPAATLGGGNEHGRPGRDSASKPKALGQDKFGYEGMGKKTWLDIGKSEYDAEIWAMTYPTLMTSLVLPIAAAVDAAIVGRIGLAQLSAVGIAGSLWTISHTLFLFLGLLSLPEAAKAKEQGNFVQLSQSTAQTICVSALIGLCLGAALFFNAESIMMHVVKPKAEVLPFAVSYMKTVAVATPASLVTVALSGVFRGLQNPKALRNSSLISCATNVVMDIIFVFGLGWGVIGAGAATVLSVYMGPIILLRILMNSDMLKVADFLKPLNPGFLLPFLAKGSVLITRSLFGYGNFLLCSICVGRLGVVESAAFEIAKQLFLLGLHSYTSLESSTQALCAKYLGRNDPGNAKGVLLRLVQVGFITGTIVGALAYIFCRPLVSLFTSNMLVAHHVVAMSLILFLPLPGNASAAILDGALLSSKETNFAALSMILASSVSILGILYLFNTGSLTMARAWMFIQIGSVGRLVMSFPKIFLSESTRFKSTSPQLP